MTAAGTGGPYGVVLDLLAHSEWADAAVFAVWAASPARDDERLRRLASHMGDVRRGFLSILSGGEPVYPPDGPPPPFEDLREATAASHDALRRFAAGLGDADWDRQVPIPWFPEPACIATVAEGLVQVALHTQHHRGQMMTRLRELGVEPGYADWIIWLWQRRPAPGWQV